MSLLFKFMTATKNIKRNVTIIFFFELCLNYFFIRYNNFLYSRNCKITMAIDNESIIERRARLLKLTMLIQLHFNSNGYDK